MIDQVERTRRRGRLVAGAGRTVFRTGTRWGRARQAARDVRRGRTGTDARTLAIAGGAGAVGGAAGAYFLDPHSGKRRRHVARDRIAAFLRRRRREAERQASYAAETARGKFEAAATPSRMGEGLNDPALAAKVESEIFRDRDAPKGRVSVNVEDGVAYLRGELERKREIDQLVRAAKKVEGVREVVSLLHRPGEEPPVSEQESVAVRNS